MAESLYNVARFFKDPEIMARTQELVREELNVLYPQLEKYREALSGKKAAIYVGGAFKAFSLVKALRLLNMQVVLVGSQTGTEEDYRELEEVTDDGTIIVYATIHHQPFPGAHGHCFLVFGGEKRYLWRRSEFKAGFAECHE